jgi:hypothetical protein
MIITPEQAARLGELAKIARRRRPRWASPDQWEDIVQDALDRGFKPSCRRRQPIDRKEPPPGFARHLKKTGRPWDSVAYFFSERLREAKEAFKQLDQESKQLDEFDESEISQPSSDTPEHAIEAEQTADAIYSSLSSGGCRIVALLAEGMSAREIERALGLDRDEVARVRQRIDRLAGALEGPGRPFAPVEEHPNRLIRDPREQALVDPFIACPARRSLLADASMGRDLARLLAPPAEEARAEVRAARENIRARQSAITGRRKQMLRKLPEEIKRSIKDGIETASDGRLERLLATHHKPTRPRRVQRSKAPIGRRSRAVTRQHQAATPSNATSA